MTKIAIVYFSGYGHTQKQAEAVFAGADSVDGAEAKLFRINEDGDLGEGEFEALAGYDAIIYGSPTYMGGPAWQFKSSPTPPPSLGSRRHGKTRLPAASPTLPR